MYGRHDSAFAVDLFPRGNVKEVGGATFATGPNIRPTENMSARREIKIHKMDVA
jgi:hypothetical protein